MGGSNSREAGGNSTEAIGNPDASEAARKLPSSDGGQGQAAPPPKTLIEVAPNAAVPEFTLWPHPASSTTCVSYTCLRSLSLRDCVCNDTVLRWIAQISPLEHLLLEPYEGQVTDAGLLHLHALTSLQSFALEIGRYADETSERAAVVMTRLCKISSLSFVVRWCQGFPELHKVTLGSWMN